jgi:hypothetical protein
MNKTLELMKKSRRGGPREGSGRPSKPLHERKVVAALRLTPHAAEYLRQNRQAIQEELERASHQQIAPQSTQSAVTRKPFSRKTVV